MSDIDTEAADSLKALDPKRPIREADMAGLAGRERPIANVSGSGLLSCNPEPHFLVSQILDNWIIPIRASNSERSAGG